MRTDEPSLGHQQLKSKLMKHFPISAISKQESNEYSNLFFDDELMKKFIGSSEKYFVSQLEEFANKLEREV
jgi:hypothetical protein